ncbi:hypothetical protein GCM10011579_057900 [Streptomyces albiflavescens]|uniref:IrrE N-terminal-like domain-containing protein n=1 Tax=Streptomyces albiflavescens TaxID=1623582 RepID=A0A918D7I4_9ACTN|nr:hypothetical protein GCM10011579_057900 [Streptomyces albiflavescens]
MYPDTHSDAGANARIRWESVHHFSGRNPTDREEIEANAFAASLLMPADLLRSELSRLPAVVRHGPERCTSALAGIFDVSDSAMGFRLINLGLVR